MHDRPLKIPSQQAFSIRNLSGRLANYQLQRWLLSAAPPGRKSLFEQLNEFWNDLIWRSKRRDDRYNWIIRNQT